MTEEWKLEELARKLARTTELPETLDEIGDMYRSSILKRSDVKKLIKPLEADRKYELASSLAYLCNLTSEAKELVLKKDVWERAEAEAKAKSGNSDVKEQDIAPIYNREWDFILGKRLLRKFLAVGFTAAVAGLIAVVYNAADKRANTAFLPPTREAYGPQIMLTFYTRHSGSDKFYVRRDNDGSINQVVVGEEIHCFQKERRPCHGKRHELTSELEQKFEAALEAQADLAFEVDKTIHNDYWDKR